jgi:hypothetical protein
MIDFKPEEVNCRNITYDKNDEYCSWYGRHLDEKTRIELFGLDVWESATDIDNGFIMIKGSLDGSEKNEKIYINGEDYKDCVKKYIQYLQRTHGEENEICLYSLDEILLLTPILETFNLRNIILFEMDLNAYFEFPLEERK